jgi:hypothetical protein
MPNSNYLLVIAFKLKAKYSFHVAAIPLSFIYNSDYDDPVQKTEFNCRGDPLS